MSIWSVGVRGLIRVSTTRETDVNELILKLKLVFCVSCVSVAGGHHSSTEMESHIIVSCAAVVRSSKKRGCVVVVCCGGGGSLRRAPLR